MNLEVGCGPKGPKEGYLANDTRPLPGVDFVCDAWEIGKHIRPNSLDNIYSRHFFEHLTFHQGRVVLGAWFNILKPGGRLEMILPNMDFHAQQWLDCGDDEEEFRKARGSIFGGQRETKEGKTWDIHKSGYNFKSLANLLRDKGFCDVLQIDVLPPQHLHITALKPI